MGNLTQPKFWMVYSPQGGAPTRRHLSRDLANSEATRLARRNPTKDFFVLKVVGGFTCPQPEVERIEIRGSQAVEIPF